VLELTVDWPGLFSAFQMNMPELRCFLSLDDGRVLKLPPGDPTLDEVRSDSKRYVPVEIIPSRIQYQWISEFTQSIEIDDTRGRVEAAINGKGAFRRFKDILLTMPEERKRWFDYRDQLMRTRISDWVKEHNVVALNPPPWTEDGTDTSGGLDHITENIVNTLLSWTSGKDPASIVHTDALRELSEEITSKLERYLK